MTVRDQVLEQLIDVIRAAEHEGGDGMKAASSAFPGTPVSVIAEAWTEWDYRNTQDWWKAVERTIDGEVIRQALLKEGSQ